MNGQRPRSRKVKATISTRTLQLDAEILVSGDIVNIIGTFEIIPPSQDLGDMEPADPITELPTCILSYSSDNLLILHPDTLISATRVSDTPVCRRKAVVQEKLRGMSESTPALVYGNLLHELLQSCLLDMSESGRRNPHDIAKMKEAFSIARREENIERLLRVPKNIEMLFMIGVEMDQARQHLREKSIGYGEFADQFVGETPKVSLHRYSELFAACLTYGSARSLPY